MKSFFSRHFTTIVIVVFVLAGLFRMNLIPLGKSTPSALKKGDFQVYNHSAIHALYYQGDFSDSVLQKISRYMDKLNLFRDKKSAVLGLILQNDSLRLMRITTDEYKKEIPQNQLYLFCALGLAVKSECFPKQTVSMQFTDRQWVAHTILSEKDMQAQLVALEKASSQQGQLASPPEDIQVLADRWATGATALAQATYYFSVEGNENWRIYYPTYVTDQVKELAAELYAGGMYVPERANFTAFYTQQSPDYFNGQPAYVLSVPFSEEQLNDGTASKTIDVLNSFLKKGYFREANLLVYAVDYDFKPVLVKFSL
jgi:hypothetical protein